MTQSPLVAGDTDSQGDVYLYDADSESLTWVSTGPTGGNAELPARIEPSAPISRWEFQFGDTLTYRAIDAAGDRVFFQTDEPLVPEDEPLSYGDWLTGSPMDPCAVSPEPLDPLPGFPFMRLTVE